MHTTHRGIARGVVCGWGCVVTVRVTTLRGADAGLYYVEHLPNYYLEPGEPPGVWGSATEPPRSALATCSIPTRSSL